MKSVSDILRDGAATFEERNALYADNYKHFGTVMMGMFPRGLTISTPDEWVRLGLLMMSLTKFTRYAANVKVGGHKDSAHDAMVYAAMLEEMTGE